MKETPEIGHSLFEQTARCPRHQSFWNGEKPGLRVYTQKKKFLFFLDPRSKSVATIIRTILIERVIRVGTKIVQRMSLLARWWRFFARFSAANYDRAPVESWACPCRVKEKNDVESNLRIRTKRKKLTSVITLRSSEWRRLSQVMRVEIQVYACFWLWFWQAGKGHRSGLHVGTSREEKGRMPQQRGQHRGTGRVHVNGNSRYDVV